jgi:hypothetical protein
MREFCWFYFFKYQSNYTIKKNKKTPIDIVIFYSMFKLKILLWKQKINNLTLIICAKNN